MVVVGQRVQIGDCGAIVKYTGEVAGTKGDWIGVEWEEENRGKHDGSHNGVRYFEAKAGCGSFVRAHKLHPGFSFSEMLQIRYTDVTGTGESMSILNRDSTSTVVELVALSDADVHRAGTLQNLVMREQCIASVGDEAFIAEKCVNTVNMDMSMNLFHDINDILRLIYLMPALQSIQLKGNVLTMRQLKEKRQPHTALERLYLASSGLSWAELCEVVAHFPSLRELYISGSTLSISDTPTSHLQSIRILDLQFSGITSWESLSDLSHLPHLNTLILSNNQIPSVSVGKEDFPHLSSLSLDGNCISSWESVAQIATLPSLTTLRIRKNPLTTGPGFDMRLLVVAMIPKLSKLNGSPISEPERLQADLFYLKYFAPENRGGGKDFHLVHPRYQSLLTEHGDPGQGGPKITAIKDQALLATVRAAEGEKEFTKKLLKTTLVKNIQVMVQRQFKIPPKKQVVSWVDPENQKIVLDDPSRDLSYYNIFTDCTLLVEKV